MIAFGSYFRLMLMAGATVLFFSSGSQALASIALPDLPRFELTAGLANSAGGARASEADTQQGERSPSEKSPTVSELALLLQGGPITSTTGTSSGASVSLPVGLLHSPASSVGLCDPAVSGWVSGENCLFLPTPPGNDLLRPPQRS